MVQLCQTQAPRASSRPATRAHSPPIVWAPWRSSESWSLSWSKIASIHWRTPLRQPRRGSPVDRGDLRPAQGPALAGAPRRPHDRRAVRARRPATAGPRCLRLAQLDHRQPGAQPDRLRPLNPEIGNQSSRALAVFVVEVEVARRLLLEPEAIVLRGLLQELGRVLEHVLAVGGFGRGRLGRRQRLLPLEGWLVHHGWRRGIGELRGGGRGGLLEFLRLGYRCLGDFGHRLGGLLERLYGVRRHLGLKGLGLNGAVLGGLALRGLGRRLTPRGAQGLVLLELELGRVRAVLALELDVLANSVVENAHRPTA